MSRRSLLFPVLFAVLFTLANCTAPRSGVPPGERNLITGTVKDSNGSVLAHASVKAVKTGSSFTGSATTDSHGDYIIDKLETGTYRVTASLDGYVPATQTTDLSAAGDQARIDFELNKKTNP